MAISNVVDSDTVTTDAGNSYRFRIGDVERDFRTVSVNYEWDRVGGNEGGYIGDVRLVNSSGDVLDTDTIQAGITGAPVSFDGTLSGSAASGETLRVELETDLIDDLTATAPDGAPEPGSPPASFPDDWLTLRCHNSIPPGGEATVGEPVDITVVNAQSEVTSVEVEFTVSVGGETVTQTREVRRGEDNNFTVTFEFDEPGTYSPDVDARFVRVLNS